MCAVRSRRHAATGHGKSSTANANEVSELTAARSSLYSGLMMKSWMVATLIVTCAGTANAEGEQPAGTRYDRYVGASLDLWNGFNGQSEFGFALQAAPLRYLELEGGAIRHDIHGKESDVWLVTGTARAKVAFNHGALFAGVGVVTGEHSAQNGCTSSGFIDFCGGQDTFVTRHWDRAVWVRPRSVARSRWGRSLCVWRSRR